jgi:hypothetical protein
MRRVFRVREWQVGQEESGLRLTVKCNHHPSVTTLGQVITSCFRGAVAVHGDKGLARVANATFPFTTEGDMLVAGPHPSSGELGDLLSLLSEILTVCDNANVSHCLDLYRIPLEGLEHNDWPHTEIGSLVYRAKYQHDVSAARQLADKLAAAIASHPALRRAELIAAVPPCGSGRHFDGPALWRGLIAERFGFQETDLCRTRTVLEQKAIEFREERARNQRNSMDCGEDVQGRAVLVIDDLYMEGDTIEEAVRALRARGASEVFALCAVKTAKGTQGGVEYLLPGAEEGDDIW